MVHLLHRLYGVDAPALHPVCTRLFSDEPLASFQQQRQLELVQHRYSRLLISRFCSASKMKGANLKGFTGIIGRQTFINAERKDNDYRHK